MTVSVLKLRGLDMDLGYKMQVLGIYNSDQLLQAARTPEERSILAEQLKVEPRVVLELANRADLARVKGIGAVFSDLLEQAGVDTVAELAMRRADNLYRKLVETNAGKKLAGRMPTQRAVGEWVAQAKALPRMLEY